MMLQRFIELGEGYSDIYELIELMKANKHRLQHVMAFHTTLTDKHVSSLALVMQPTHPGDFQAIYICREGIPNYHVIPNKRFDLFQQAAQSVGKDIIELDIQPSVHFAETALYYQHLIGILRMNRLIAPLQ